MIRLVFYVVYRTYPGELVHCIYKRQVIGVINGLPLAPAVLAVLIQEVVDDIAQGILDRNPFATLIGCWRIWIPQ